MRDPRQLVFPLLAAVALAWTLPLLPGCERKAPSPADEQAASTRIAPHFVDSAPEHGEEFLRTPVEVVVNFDRPLSPGSRIEVTRKWREAAGGTTRLSEDRSSMRVSIAEDLPGKYEVQYTARWPDGSEDVGRFSFSVDRKLGREYEDMTGQAQVRVVLKDCAFQPPWIVVSRGTIVTWLNEDAEAHPVRSDPHASHDLLVGLDTGPLVPGAEASYLFDRLGEWPYHCPSRYPEMRGRVVVVEPPAESAPATRAVP
ncbi:MAG: copper resistance protein CopC [Coriobacteriia bacterium]|nr:copper resistance protein CopC [Coriobacteriia bacterium]